MELAALAPVVPEVEDSAALAPVVPEVEDSAALAPVALEVVGLEELDSAALAPVVLGEFSLEAVERAALAPVMLGEVSLEAVDSVALVPIVPEAVGSAALAPVVPEPVAGVALAPVALENNSVEFKKKLRGKKQGFFKDALLFYSFDKVLTKAINVSILQQKPKLPSDFVKIKKGDKVLFLNPSAPDWIVVSPNGAAILLLCNGKRTVENISESLSMFWRKGLKAEIIQFIENIITNTTFFSPPTASPVYQPHGLSIVQLSLVDECNLKCIYCYATGRPKSTNRLTREDHFKLVDDINAISKYSEIVLTGGEPLLSPYTVELADYAKSLGNQVHLLTNGTLINKKNAKQISETFNLIKISVDGSTPEIHEFHRGKGCFSKTMKAIDLLIQHGAPLQIAMTVTKQNIHDVDAMTRKFGSRLTFAPLFVAGQARSNKELSITGKEYYEALSSVAGVKPLSYLCSSLAVSKQKRIMKCAIGDGEISISEDGDVYPCQLLHSPHFKAGNIRYQLLKNIYESSEVLQFCRKLTVLEIPGCKKCELRFICGGACRARAFYEENRLDVSGSFCEYEKLAFINGLFELHEF